MKTQAAVGDIAGRVGVVRAIVEAKGSGAPAAEDAPAEESPAQGTPAEETPAEEAPATEAPAEETPAAE